MSPSSTVVVAVALVVVIHFCSHVNRDRILYLLENKMIDLDSLLMDETRDSYTFEAR